MEEAEEVEVDEEKELQLLSFKHWQHHPKASASELVEATLLARDQFSNCLWLWCNTCFYWDLVETILIRN